MSTPTEPEVIYAIRRCDGKPMFDEMSFMLVGHPNDWSPAVDDSEDRNTEVDYEIVKMTVERVDSRTFVLGHDLIEWQRMTAEDAELFGVEP